MCNHFLRFPAKNQSEKLTDNFVNVTTQHVILWKANLAMVNIRLILISKYLDLNQTSCFCLSDLFNPVLTSLNSKSIALAEVLPSV